MLFDLLLDANDLELKQYKVYAPKYNIKQYDENTLHIEVLCYGVNKNDLKACIVDNNVLHIEKKNSISKKIKYKQILRNEFGYLDSFELKIPFNVDIELDEKGIYLNDGILNIWISTKKQNSNIESLNIK